MAERRMFAKTIIRSDAFLDMPASTQNLYFHLNHEADDEGFVNNPKTVMRVVKASEDDLRLLIAKKFIIPFESGVVVIKHWRIHNYIQNDRFHETKYKKERDTLYLDENKAYTQTPQSLPEPCIHDVSILDTEVRLGKVSIDICDVEVEKPGPKGYLPLIDGTEYPVYADQIEKWEGIYPNVDVKQELRNMLGWLEGNPKKRKTKAGILRFVTGWLARAQERA